MKISTPKEIVEQRQAKLDEEAHQLIQSVELRLRCTPSSSGWTLNVQSHAIHIIEHVMERYRQAGWLVEYTNDVREGAFLTFQLPITSRPGAI